MKRNSIFLATSVALLALPGCETLENDYRPASSYENRHTPRVTALTNGSYFVAMGTGKTASFNRFGGLIAQSNLSPSELREAQDAVHTYRREQSGSDEHSPPGGWGGSAGVPVVNPRGDGKLEVQMPSGGVVLYDRYGRMIQKGATVTGRDLSSANRAVQSYLREQ